MQLLTRHTQFRWKYVKEGDDIKKKYTHTHTYVKQKTSTQSLETVHALVKTNPFTQFGVDIMQSSLKLKGATILDTS